MELKNNYPICNPSSLRITTHSAKSKINSKINLEVFAKNLELDSNIIYFKFKNGIIEYTKGVNPKKNIKKKSNGKFYNQITIVVQPEPGFYNNIKLFRNGSISMTGIKKQENGYKSISIILSKMKNIEGSLIDNIDNDCKILEYDITLINSDYEVSFEIKRDVLQEILVKNYKIYSSYEPCIYPGVNSKFYWNKEYENKEFYGKCYCSLPCTGKGDGNGNGRCKKVTIAIFQSGSIIITGARKLEQISAAYNFINNILEKYSTSLTQVKASFLETTDKYINKKEKNKNNIYLKISSIRNMPPKEKLEELKRLVF